MCDLKTMERVQREAIKKSRLEGKKLYFAIRDRDENVFKCPAVTKKIIGYNLINTYFVDNSGFGSDSEPALTASQFLNKVKQGFYYGIISQGQFQVYIGEYQKI